MEDVNRKSNCIRKYWPAEEKNRYQGRSARVAGQLRLLFMLRGWWRRLFQMWFSANILVPHLSLLKIRKMERYHFEIGQVDEQTDRLKRYLIYRFAAYNVQSCKKKRKKHSLIASLVIWTRCHQHICIHFVTLIDRERATKSDHVDEGLLSRNSEATNIAPAVVNYLCNTRSSTTNPFLHILLTIFNFLHSYTRS